jgi:hypothetical protein
MELTYYTSGGAGDAGDQYAGLEPVWSGGGPAVGPVRHELGTYFTSLMKLPSFSPMNAYLRISRYAQ